MRRTAFASAVALAATIAIAGPAVGAPGRLALCHYDADAGRYVLLSLPERAHRAHLAKHADDVVPNSSGECPRVRPPALLARAFTTMSDGTERLIAQLIDTDRSGTINAGDVVQVAGFPGSFDADPPVVPVEVSEHVIPPGADVSQFSTTLMWVEWITVVEDRTEYRAFRFTATGATEWFQEVFSPNFGVATSVSTRVTDGFGINPDLITLTTATPSRPQFALDLTGAPGSELVDDDFIDVELYLP